MSIAEDPSTWDQTPSVRSATPAAAAASARSTATRKVFTRQKPKPKVTVAPWF